MIQHQKLYILVGRLATMITIIVSLKIEFTRLVLKSANSYYSQGTMGKQPLDQIVSDSKVPTFALTPCSPQPTEQRRLRK